MDNTTSFTHALFRSNAEDEQNIKVVYECINFVEQITPHTKKKKADLRNQTDEALSTIIDSQSK